MNNYLPSLICESKLFDMMATASKVPLGCFVELGVYKGGSASRLYEMTEKQNRRLHLFDTFTGMPFQDSGDFHKVGDFSDTNLEDLKKAMPNAIFHAGIFPDTMPSHIEQIAFIHFDGDQYQSAKDIRRFLWPSMVRGGILFIDDFEHFPPVGKAFNEDFPNAAIRTTTGQFCVVKT